MVEQAVKRHLDRIWAGPSGRWRRLRRVRLDRALGADLVSALRAPAVAFYLALQVVAAAVFIWRRGSDTLSTVLLIWLALLILAFFAWWAGRHPQAHPQPDAVPASGARSVFALLAVAGMITWGAGWSVPLGLVLFLCGLGGWSWSAWRSGSQQGLRVRLARDPRPFLPMLLLIGLPRLLAGGPSYLVEVVLALPSGVGQQLLYLVGLYAPLEALGHRASAAVVSSLLFALIHVPLLLDANGGDALAAVANAMLFQAGVGLVACLGYQRHRAAVPIGVAHALAIA